MNFAEALRVKTDEIKRPPLVPLGTYQAVVDGQPQFGQVANGSYDTVDFKLKLIQPTEDVDPDALSEYGSLKTASIRHRFMFDKNDKSNFDRSLFNIKRFLNETLMLPEGPELGQLISESAGKPLLVKVKYRPDPQNPEIMYAEVERTAPLT